jgi:hypothetical protein
MTLLVVALLAAAAVTLGLRTTTVLDGREVHPIDRLALGLVAGLSLVWVSLAVSTRYRAFEAGLGLLVSLAPAGVYDLLRWYYRSRRPWASWVAGPVWILTIRLLLTLGLLLALAGAYVAIGGVINGSG